MIDERRPAPDPGGPEGSSFTLVGRITRWDPITRELTIGGRVLRVADSVLFVSDVVAGISIMASGYQPPDPSNRWVVTHLRAA
jgi:hypothetical protein